MALLPPPSLIEVCKAMATIATLVNPQNIDDDDIYLGKGKHMKQTNTHQLPSVTLIPDGQRRVNILGEEKKLQRPRRNLVMTIGFCSTIV